MSQQNRSLHDETFVADGAITARRLVGFDGAQATAAGQKVAGPAVCDALTTEAVPVTMYGTGIVESGGVFAVGDDLVADTQGRAVKATALGITIEADVDAQKLPVTSTPTVDDTKLTLDAGATPATSSAANGAVISAASGFVSVASTIAPAEDAVTATGTFAGGTLPQYVFGTALQAASGAGEFIEVALGR